MEAKHNKKRAPQTHTETLFSSSISAPRANKYSYHTYILLGGGARRGTKEEDVEVVVVVFVQGIQLAICNGKKKTR